MDASTRKTIGRYEVIELLGRGGMAEVYRARDPNLGRDVAIKLIAPALASADNFERRFSIEARAIASMIHPHIVQAYDFGLSEQGPYMVMEYVPGRTLKDKLRAVNSGQKAESSEQPAALSSLPTAVSPLPLPEITRILTAIGSALDYAHSKGIIHRDIKPTNILFREDGTPVLADFGIARVVDTTQLTNSAALTGTPAYIAPEQANGKPVPQSDLYSLACVLFEMLTGQPPFSASSLTEMVMKHVQQTPPDLHTLRSDLPPTLNIILQKALAKHLEDRYPTGAALTQAFAASLNEFGSLKEFEGLGEPRSAVLPQTLKPSNSKQPFESPNPKPASSALSGLNAAARMMGALVGRKPETAHDEQGKVGQWITLLGALGVILTALQFIVQSLNTLTGVLGQLSQSLTVIAGLALVGVIVAGVRVTQVSPRYRRRAWLAVGMCAVAGLSWSAYAIYENYLRPPIGPVILVSEFQPCKTCGDKTFDDDIYIELKQQVSRLKFPAEVRRINRGFADSDEARAEGAANKATLVIWGNYDQDFVSPRFELLNQTQQVDLLLGSDDLRTFNYRLGTERKLEHVAFLSLGLLRYIQRDYGAALPLFDKAIASLPQGDAQKEVNAAAAYFYRGMTRLYTGEPTNDVVSDLETARMFDSDISVVHQNLALVYFSACNVHGGNRLADALSEIDLVRKADPTNALPYELRGNILAAQRRWHDAAEAYEAALQQSNANPDTVISLMQAYDKAGQPAEAKRVQSQYADKLSAASDPVAQLWQAEKYTEAVTVYTQRLAELSKQPGTEAQQSRAYVTLGMTYMGSKDYKAARDALQASIKLAPRYFGLRRQNADSPYAMLGRTYLELGDFNNAIEQYQRALTLSPCDDGAASGLAQVFEKQNQPQQALVYYKQAAAANPNAPESAFSLARLLNQLNYPKNEVSAAYSETVRRYEALLQNEPTQAISWRALGVARLELSLPSAEEAFAQAERLDPVNYPKPADLVPPATKALLQESNTLFVNGDLKQAQVLAQRAVDQVPKYAIAHMWLGYLLNQSGQSVAALPELQAAIAISPTYAEAFIELGSANLRLKKYEDAAKALRTATELKPDNANTWLQLANVLNGLNRPSEAIAPAQQSVKLQSDDPFAHNALGFALFGSGDYTNAVSALTRSLELSPTQTFVLQQLSTAHYQLQQFDQAAQVMGRLVDLNPQNADAVGSYAFLLTEANRIERGFAIALRAQALNPVNTMATMALVQYALGMGYKAKGDSDKARIAFQFVIDSSQATTALKDKARQQMPP